METPNDKRVYKPEFKELSNDQQDAINKHAAVVDGDVFKMVVDHMKTNFINDMLFPHEETGVERSMNDQYFRGFLAGLEAYYGFIHERAEMARERSLQP